VQLHLIQIGEGVKTPEVSNKLSRVSPTFTNDTGGVRYNVFFPLQTVPSERSRGGWRRMCPHWSYRLGFARRTV